MCDTFSTGEVRGRVDLPQPARGGAERVGRRRTTTTAAIVPADGARQSAVLELSGTGFEDLPAAENPRSQRLLFEG
jgi:hypothetical protein